MNTAASTSPSKFNVTAKIVFVLLAFFLPLCGALAIAGWGVTNSAEIEKLDFAFCMLTLTNCVSISPFLDVTGWDRLLIRNGIVISIWFVYAAAIYVFFNAVGGFWKIVSASLVVVIPVSLAVLSLLIVLMQGAQL